MAVTKDKILATAARLAERLENVDPLLRRAADNEQFYNVSPLTMTRLLDDPPHTADNLRSYLLAFSPAARDVLEKFDLPVQIDRLDRADLLNLVVSRFCDIDLHPEAVTNLEMGNSFSDGGFGGEQFDYLLANPPFGVEWKKAERKVRDEHDSLGFAGRFGAGLPRINDGSSLFLQHMIAKMKPVEQGGSRLAIVFNGSRLFTGAAGSGESEIRRWIIENDWLEAVVALPGQLFYNTGISTYSWVVTNRKSVARGKVQLVDARQLWQKMRKSLGEKRKELSADHIAEITRLYGAFEESEQVLITAAVTGEIDIPGAA